MNRLSEIFEHKRREVAARACDVPLEQVRAQVAASGKDRPVGQAETVVATLDGVLLGALLIPVGRRASYLDRALAHVFGSLQDSPEVAPSDPIV